MAQLHPCYNKINLGLCCINSTLGKQKPPVTTNRGLVSLYTNELAIQRATANLKDLHTMIQWNHDHNIKCFRMSSDMFPRFTDLLAEHRYTEVENENKEDKQERLQELEEQLNKMETMEPNYSMKFAKPLLKEAGELAKRLGQRILMHPCQSCVVGTPTWDSFVKTRRTLWHHAQILDYMEIPTVAEVARQQATNNDASHLGAGVLIVHGGGIYINEIGTKPKKPTGNNDTVENQLIYQRDLTDIRLRAKKITKERWIKQFKLLPDCVKRRLVIENDEDDFNIRDCVEIGEACQIPVVVDFFHYQCYQERHYYEDLDPTMMERNSLNEQVCVTSEFSQLFSRVLATWKGTRPVMHLSQRIAGVAPTSKQACAHSDYIDKIPDYVLQVLSLCPTAIDLEIEAKAKELAIFQLWRAQPELYPFVCPTLEPVVEKVKRIKTEKVKNESNNESNNKPNTKKRKSSDNSKVVVKSSRISKL